MKRFYLILIVLFSVVTTVKSQEAGIRMGWQEAMTYNKGEIVGEGLKNFYIGLSHIRNLGRSKILSLYSGLEFTQNGYKADDSNYRKINYIGLPIALRVKLGPLFAQAGYNANIRIGEKLKVNSIDALISSTKSKWCDFPLQFGAGIKLSILTIEARYHYGIVKVNNDNKIAYFQVGAGISF